MIKKEKQAIAILNILCEGGRVQGAWPRGPLPSPVAPADRHRPLLCLAGPPAPPPGTAERHHVKAARDLALGAADTLLIWLDEKSQFQGPHALKMFKVK